MYALIIRILFTTRSSLDGARCVVGSRWLIWLGCPIPQGLIPQGEPLNQAMRSLGWSEGAMRLPGLLRRVKPLELLLPSSTLLAWERSGHASRLGSAWAQRWQAAHGQGVVRGGVRPG